MNLRFLKLFKYFKYLKHLKYFRQLRYFLRNFLVSFSLFVLFSFVLFSSVHSCFALTDSVSNETINEIINVSINQTVLLENITFSVNSTELLPSNQTNITILEYCSPVLTIDSDRLIYNNSERIRIYNKLSLNKFDYIIEYWVEDIFGNIVKPKILTANTNSKQYTPKIDETDKILILKNRLVFINCIINSSGSLSSNNSVLNVTNEKYVFVRNFETNSFAQNSSININKIYLNKDNFISFGEILQVNLDVYRGDTLKYAVKAWVSDYRGWKVSEVTTIHVKPKFTNHIITLPIALKSDCNSRYGDGVYTLNIEGLNLSVQEKINIRGSSKFCKNITVEKNVCTNTTSEKKPKFVFDLIAPKFIDNNPEYYFYIENNHNESHTFSLSSYLFSGSRKFSEILNKIVILPPYSVKSVKFNLNHHAFSGFYKIMVKAVVDEQKTIRSFSEDVVVFLPAESVSSVQIPLLTQGTISPIPELNSSKSLLSGLAVYESTSESSKNLIPYSIISALIVMVFVMLVWKK